MKNILLVLVAVATLFSCTKKENNHERNHGILRIHEGAYAFCGASSAVPTGRKITVQGVVYDEGCAICPVLVGPSISNLAMYGEGGTWGDFNVEENQITPDGTENTVWSFFWYFDSTTTVPQFNRADSTWEWMKPSNRAFTIDMSSPETSESNMFAMPGRIIDTLENGIILAECFGPLNEDAVPLRKTIPVKNGETSITAAKEGSPYPVGTPIPSAKLIKSLK
jgi:hypothetical protein